MHKVAYLVIVCHVADGMAANGWFFLQVVPVINGLCECAGGVFVLFLFVVSSLGGIINVRELELDVTVVGLGIVCDS